MGRFVPYKSFFTTHRGQAHSRARDVTPRNGQICPLQERFHHAQGTSTKPCPLRYSQKWADLSPTRAFLPRTGDKPIAASATRFSGMGRFVPYKRVFTTHRGQAQSHARDMTPRNGQICPLQDRFYHAQGTKKHSLKRLVLCML